MCKLQPFDAPQKERRDFYRDGAGSPVQALDGRPLGMPRLRSAGALHWPAATSTRGTLRTGLRRENGKLQTAVPIEGMDSRLIRVALKAARGKLAQSAMTTIGHLLTGMLGTRQASCSAGQNNIQKQHGV